MGVPPGRVTVAAVRRRLVRRRVREAAGGLAAVVVVAVLGVTAAVRVFGAAPGPAAAHRPAVPATVYVGFQPRTSPSTSTLTPINAATNTAGKPIRVPCSCSFAITPDGKTLYVATSNSVIPISTATNTPGKPIHIGTGPRRLDRDRPGREDRLRHQLRQARHGHPGQPRHQHARQADHSACPAAIAFTPDGKTAYVVSPRPGPSTVIPVNTATDTPGKPIRVGPERRADRDHAGREDRLRHGPAHGHPDQHRHQHARQADPHRQRPGCYRDHPGREDRLRRQHLRG